MDDADVSPGPLTAIQEALISGIEVEDLLEAAIPRETASERTGFMSKLRAYLEGERARPAPETVRKIADGLDAFAAGLAQTATVLEDVELDFTAAQNRDLGRALWDSEITIEHAYNEVRSALVELCRRRASLLTGRQLHTLR